MELKKLFKNTRRLLQLNQKEFAKRIGVSQASVSRYEKGLVQPSAQILLKIQDITRGD
ncbi:MAG TPA: helix-turn-helix domain-containing protein [Desulfobacterales bacterium]|nr:helix-turn-helix domain-containing protein [Desulfobacterales bacterium]